MSIFQCVRCKVEKQDAESMHYIGVLIDNERLTIRVSLKDDGNGEVPICRQCMYDEISAQWARTAA